MKKKTTKNTTAWYIPQAGSCEGDGWLEICLRLPCDQFTPRGPVISRKHIHQSVQSFTDPELLGQIT